MVNIEVIIKELEEHNISKEKLEEIRKSYHLADEIHKNQFRQSGEPYIIHPLSVAKNLLEMEVYDPDTISAALLHDTIEDAEDDFSKEDIANIINPEVAELVDGVTKMRRLNFYSKNEQKLANIRKIINGLNKDLRIILIKLADRLHNMRTLEYKSEEKQKENALETMELFVPLALTIGAYEIKSELEDIALRYIEPDEYFRIKEQKELLKEVEQSYLEEMNYKIRAIMINKRIPNEILLRTKNVCTTYKKIKQGYKLENIYDLFYLKILVDEVDDCFKTLAIVHSQYPPINGRFKDYIFNPRTNFYQSLHTTVTDSNGKMIKTKIRTFDMDKISAFGLPAYWNIKDHKTKEETQKYLRGKQFSKKLSEFNESLTDNKEFFEYITQELLTEHVYVYTESGEIIELPNGSTAIDFACQVFPNKLDHMTGVIVNEKEVEPNYTLKNNDRVEIVISEKISLKDWERFATTSSAKQKLKQLKDNN